MVAKEFIVYPNSIEANKDINIIKSFSSSVIGAISPYPIVLIVTTEK
jgi:hypothetical protein